MYMACKNLLYCTMLCLRHYLQSGHTNNNLQNGDEFDCVDPEVLAENI